jgi:hypothetical protein
MNSKQNGKKEKCLQRRIADELSGDGNQKQKIKI